MALTTYDSNEAYLRARISDVTSDEVNGLKLTVYADAGTDLETFVSQKTVALPCVLINYGGFAPVPYESAQSKRTRSYSVFIRARQADTESVIESLTNAIESEPYYLRGGAKYTARVLLCRPLLLDFGFNCYELQISISN